MNRILLTFLVFLSSPLWASTLIYKSPNKIDFVKIVGAKKEEKEGGLKHPYKWNPEQIRAILRSIHFNKAVMLKQDIQDQQLFGERNVEFLAPYLMEAFQKAGPEEVVVVSYFTEKSKLLVPDDRLTIFRAYIKEDGLHVKFLKLYAKLLGDRTTKGAERAIQEAKGMHVSLELQPGQNRISWDPEELVFGLKYDFKGSGPPEQEVRVKMKPSSAGAAPQKSVRERLKELDRLKEDELITEKEYQKKRKELLKEL